MVPKERQKILEEFVNTILIFCCCCCLFPRTRKKAILPTALSDCPAIHKVFQYQIGFSDPLQNLILSILFSPEREIFAPSLPSSQLIDSSLVKRELCWIFLPLRITKHWLFVLPHPSLGHIVNTEVGELTAKAAEKG